MRTEISAKFTRQSVQDGFAEAGLCVDAWYTDERERFALALSSPSKANT
jgi:L-histidine N-alpha-methyltransferase